MIGGRGRLIDWGEFSRCIALTWRPSNAASVPRSPDHMSWA